MAARKDERDTPEQAVENTAETMAEGSRQAAEIGRQTRRAGESAAESAIHTSGRMAEQGANQAAEIGRRQSEQVRALLGAGTRLYGDLNETSKEDVDTLMQSSARLAKGVQDMSWEVMYYTQQSLQLGLRTANDLMTCRTVDDLLDLQRNFVRESVDTFLQESAKLLEMSSGVATDAAAPIQQRPQGEQRGNVRH